ncbi:MAG: hypothetical protein IJ588_01155 [Prevotella sp.]|nr:hypothetical protein [Prevotella sp.]
MVKYHVDIWERNRRSDTPIENVYEAENPKEVIDFFGLREPDVERFELKEVVEGSGWRSDPKSKYAPIGASKKPTAKVASNPNEPIRPKYKEYVVRNHGMSVVIVGETEDGRQVRIELMDSDLEKILHDCKETDYDYHKRGGSVL